MKELHYYCFVLVIRAEKGHKALCSSKNKTKQTTTIPSLKSLIISKFFLARESPSPIISHQHTGVLCNARGEISDLQRNPEAEHYANTSCNCSPLLTGGTQALYCQGLLMTPN